MATKRVNNVQLLYKPIAPTFSKAFLGVGLLVAIGILGFVLTRNSLPAEHRLIAAPSISTPPKATHVPTVTPTPVDMSNWKTYRDWKYGFSIKLPPQYYSMQPGRGATGSDPDPTGGGEMNFEDSQYGMPNNNYGFTVRIHKGNHREINCNTDEDCYDKMYNLEKTFPHTNTYPLQTKILDRNIKGYAMQAGGESIAAGRIDDVYYEFAINSQPYELNIYDIGNYDQLNLKQPFINAIASTISFNQ